MRAACATARWAAAPLSRPTRRALSRGCSQTPTARPTRQACAPGTAVHGPPWSACCPAAAREPGLPIWAAEEGGWGNSRYRHTACGKAPLWCASHSSAQPPTSSAPQGRREAAARYLAAAQRLGALLAGGQSEVRGRGAALGRGRQARAKNPGRRHGGAVRPSRLLSCLPPLPAGLLYSRATPPYELCPNPSSPHPITPSAAGLRAGARPVPHLLPPPSPQLLLAPHPRPATSPKVLRAGDGRRPRAAGPQGVLLCAGARRLRLRPRREHRLHWWVAARGGCVSCKLRVTCLRLV